MSDSFLSLIRKTCTFDKRRFAKDVQRFQTLSLPPPKQTHVTANGHSGSKRQKTQHGQHTTQASHDSEQADVAEEGKADVPDADDVIEDERDHVDEHDEDGSESELASPTSPPADAEDGAISLFAHSTPLPDSPTAAAPQPSRLRALKQLRKQHQIHIHGPDVPDPFTAFTELTALGLPSHVLNNITAPPPHGLGFDDPTPIQMQAIPVMVAGRECIGCAPTGSGKSVAYLLPLLISMYTAAAKAKESKRKDRAREVAGGVHAIVIAPTKELATQIHRISMRLTQPRKHRLLLLSKANANALTFQQPIDLLVCTPWRLHALLTAVEVDVSGLQHVVLDEADRLLDLGFMEQVDDVLARLRGKGQTVRRYALHLFSATIPQALDALLPSLLHSPVKVVIAERNIAQSTVEQSLQFVGHERGKLLALSNMRSAGLTVPMLVFVQSSSRAQQLLQYLQHEGLTSIAAMHGELSSKQRLDVLSAFRSGATSILITTDLLSRGMDLLNVACVLNFDFPQSTTSYIHRIGRTGRAGRTGHAITLFTENDRPLLRHVASVMRLSGQEVAGWMLGLGRVGRGRGAKLDMVAPARESIVRQSEEDKKRHAKKRIRKEKERTHAAEELHGRGPASDGAKQQVKRNGFARDNDVNGKPKALSGQNNQSAKLSGVRKRKIATI